MSFGCHHTANSKTNIAQKIRGNIYRNDAIMNNKQNISYITANNFLKGMRLSIFPLMCFKRCADCQYLELSQQYFNRHVSCFILPAGSNKHQFEIYPHTSNTVCSSLFPLSVVQPRAFNAQENGKYYTPKTSKWIIHDQHF